MSRDDVISDLIRAANRLDNFTCLQRHILLSRAADAITNYRDALDITSPNGLGSGDIVFDLYAMAYSIELYRTQEVSEVMLRAATIIKTMRVELSRT